MYSGPRAPEQQELSHGEVRRAHATYSFVVSCFAEYLGFRRPRACKRCRPANRCWTGDTPVATTGVPAAAAACKNRTARPFVVTVRVICLLSSYWHAAADAAPHEPAGDRVPAVGGCAPHLTQGSPRRSDTFSGFLRGHTLPRGVG